MDLILLAVLAVGVWGARLRKDAEHLSREQTCSINGFFVLLVFLRHTVDYITPGPWDGIFWAVNRRLDQLIVVPFLFYSGYGIMRSILAKGRRYVADLPRSRFLKVWLHFALAVGLYVLVGVWLQKGYGLKRTLLSFTGWDSIGNSNWYIFATLMMYLFTWLAFTLFRRSNTLAVAGLTALAVGYILVLRPIKGLWWYDTALVYPAGMIYGLNRDKIDDFLRKKAWFFLIFFGGAFVLCWFLRSGLWWREAMAVAFALTVLCATMKFRIENPALAFLGKYTFEIYILQRIPMLLLRGRIPNQYVYLAVSFGLTLLLAVGFRRVLDRLDGWLFKRGGKV